MDMGKNCSALYAVITIETKGLPMLVCLLGILLFVAMGHPDHYLCADTAHLPKKLRSCIKAREGTISGIMSFVLFLHLPAKLQCYLVEHDGIGRSREHFGLGNQETQHLHSPDCCTISPTNSITDDYFVRVEDELSFIDEAASTDTYPLSLHAALAV